MVGREVRERETYDEDCVGERWGNRETETGSPGDTKSQTLNTNELC